MTAATTCARDFAPCAMMRISINRLGIRALVGVYEAELSSPQTVFADISLEADTDESARSDDLGDTIDYAALADSILLATGNGRVFHLIEFLAGEIARACIGFDSRIAKAAVTVVKPSALAGRAASASVTVSATRG